MDEALRLIDGRAVRQRDNGTNPRSGHQPAAHWIVSRNAKYHLVEPRELQAHHPANGQQRLDDTGKSGQTFDELADPILEPEATDNPDLQAKVA
jgi:hypothetical protein